MNKKFLVRGMLVAGFGLAGLMVGHEAQAAEWVANTPDQIQIQSGDTSYTMVSGDTMWAIAQKTNLNLQTLADVNKVNLAAGEQYSLEVGRKIVFDGMTVTVVKSDGKVVSQTTVTDANKVNPSQNIGEAVNGSGEDVNYNGQGVGNTDTDGNTNTNTNTNTDVNGGGTTEPGGNTGGGIVEPGDNGNGGETPTEPSNPGNGGNEGGETPTEPSNPGEGGNTEEPGNGGNTEEPGNGGETPTDPSNPGDGGNTGGNEGGNTEEPGEKVYAGEYIDGANNGAVGTWTDKNAMMDYIENNWDAVSGGLNDYSMTTNGYGWIAMFY